VVRASLKGKSVRRALKVIAEHGPENVNVAIQGTLKPAAVPGVAVVADQPEIGLVHQGRGLEGLAWRLAAELLCCQLTELIVDEQQEVAGSTRVALFDRRKDARDVVHRREPP
jgi:hypothetical protein